MREAVKGLVLGAICVGVAATPSAVFASDGGLFEIEDYSFDIEQTLGIGDVDTTGAAVLWFAPATNKVILQSLNLSVDGITFDTSNSAVSYDAAVGRYCIGGTVGGPCNLQAGVPDFVLAFGGAGGDFFVGPRGDRASNVTVTLESQRTAVPEPLTWMMMLLGFGAVGWVHRCRREIRRLAKAATYLPTAKCL